MMPGPSNHEGAILRPVAAFSLYLDRAGVMPLDQVAVVTAHEIAHGGSRVSARRPAKPAVGQQGLFLITDFYRSRRCRGIDAAAAAHTASLGAGRFRFRDPGHCKLPDWFGDCRLLITWSLPATCVGAAARLSDSGRDRADLGEDDAVRQVR
jgi:hypothetical protein